MGDCLGILRVVNAASLFFHASASCLGSETVVLIEIVVFSKGRRSRPHHQESTGSRPITAVKPGWAKLVLGWETAWEYFVS